RGLHDGRCHHLVASVLHLKLLNSRFWDGTLLANMNRMRANVYRFLRRDQHGFSAAEKVLILCFALALIFLVASLVRQGSQKAGEDAKKALLSGGQGVASQLGQITPNMPSSGELGNAGGPSGGGEVKGGEGGEKGGEGGEKKGPEFKGGGKGEYKGEKN